MPITALPATTVRAIGSSQALTDPASLVKELVDNAIDGHANTISVEVSVNTLSEIRVKDNGHGINPDDRPMICQRHCTSKLKDLEELKVIGGRSLGFRGVALASAAELSGVLTISTRIDGEETASEIKFDREGHVASEKRTSLPVGTTVRAERFLEALPVRRQAVEKTTTKTLAKIRRILQSHAFARPHLRLSLKILKAKDEKSNWKYPVHSGASVTKIKTCSFNAAMDIMGKKVTNQCQWMHSTWSSVGEHIGTTSDPLNVGANEESTYTFEAVLAKSGCDGSIISHLGQYVSVDSRPVSCARGVLKQIASIYKSRVRSTSASGNDTKITDPFLCMNLICPPGSYDANIEPAKDDVIFTGTDLIISLVEKFFDSNYGTVPSETGSTAASSLVKPRGLELLLARKTSSSGVDPLASGLQSKNSCPSSPPQPGSTRRSQQLTTLIEPGLPASSADSPNQEHCMLKPRDHSVTAGGDDTHSDSSPGEVSPNAGRKVPGTVTVGHNRSTWKTSMYAEGDEDDGELEGSSDPPAQSASDDLIEDEGNLKNVRVSNPWAFAKLNAPFRPPHRSQGLQQVDTAGNTQLPTPRRQKGDAHGSAHQSSDDVSGTTPEAADLPTPRRTQHEIVAESAASSPSPFPFPLRARGKRKAERPNEIAASPYGDSDGRGSLDAWAQRSLISHREDHQLSDSENENGRGSRGPADITQSGPFISARALPRGTPLSDIPDVSDRSRRKADSRKPQQQCTSERAHVAPVHDLEKVWFDTGEKRKRKQGHPRQRVSQTPDPHSLVLQDVDSEDSIPPSQSESSVTSLHPDLAITMDYEARKQLATQNHRQSLSRRMLQSTIELGAEAGTPTASPHANRQRAAIAALQNDSEAPHDAPIFVIDDPRAYLIRTNQTEESEGLNKPEKRKFRRRKTTKLPFETLRQGDYIGDLVHIVSTNLINFETLLSQTGVQDDYIRSGTITDLFPTPTESQIQGWQERLKAIVKAQYRIEGMDPAEEMDGELECDLGSILQRHAEIT